MCFVGVGAGQVRQGLFPCSFSAVCGRVVRDGGASRIVPKSPTATVQRPEALDVGVVVRQQVCVGGAPVAAAGCGGGWAGSCGGWSWGGLRTPVPRSSVGTQTRWWAVGHLFAPAGGAWTATAGRSAGSHKQDDHTSIPGRDRVWGHGTKRPRAGHDRGGHAGCGEELVQRARQRMRWSRRP